MPAVSSPPASHLPSKKKKPTPLAVVQAVAQAAQAATAAATAVAQTSPSYVAPSSTSSSSSSSSSPAPTKAPPSLAKEFIKDSKKPKTVSGKYAKESEKAQAKRAKESAKVKRKTAEVKAKYAPVGKTIKKVGKAAPAKRHYYEDGSWVSAKKYAKHGTPPKHPRKAAQRRSDALYAKTGLPGKAPKVMPGKRVAETDAGNSAAGWVNGFGNKIRFAPVSWAQLSGPDLAYGKDTKALLLHEFAHTKQNPAVQASGQAEGLAERYAARQGRELGIPNAPTPEYRRYKEAAPGNPKLVMKRQFVNGHPDPDRRYVPSVEQRLAQKSPSPAPRGKKYLDVPEFGPGNAYKVWEGSNQIAAKAKELSRGKTGRAETEATRNAARAAEALSRAVTAKGAGPKPRKVANRLEKAVSKSQGTIPDDVPQQYRGLIADASRRYGVPAALLSAVLRQESGFDPNVGSPAGAQGIAQFMPGTAKGMGVDPYDPSSAIPGAARLLAGNKDQFGSWDLALAAYNAGGGAVSQYGGIPPYPETQNYVKTIMGAVGNMDVAAKDIPTQIKRTARQTLGKQATKAILRGGQVIKDKNAGEETKGTIPYKETKKYIVPTEAKSEIRAEQRAPARTMITGMDPALQAALVQLAKNTGIPVRINEGYRTTERANDFPSGTASQHHQGNAADIDNNADYSAEDLAKVGLNNTAVGGEAWHFQLNNPDATPSTVNTNIPIKGTKLAVKVPTPASGSSTATGTASGTTFSGSAPTSTSGMTTAQIEAELKRKGVRSPSLRKRLAKIDRWMTSPLTAETPEISQELIDRILGK